jgi:hypothetical protein
MADAVRGHSPDYQPWTRPHRGGTPIAGPACLSAGPRREGTSISRAGARPGASRKVAGTLGTVAGDEAVTDAMSVGPGATRPEPGRGRRTSRMAHPRTTGAAAHRPGATRTALGPHTPDRGASARPPPSRSCGRAASERSAWDISLERVGQRLAEACDERDIRACTENHPDREPGRPARVAPKLPLGSPMWPPGVFHRRITAGPGPGGRDDLRRIEV